MMQSLDKRIDALEQAARLWEKENNSRISRMESEKRLEAAFAILGFNRSMQQVG